MPNKKNMNEQSTETANDRQERGGRLPEVRERLDQIESDAAYYAGVNLRALRSREALNWSQDVMCERLGNLSRTVYSYWENSRVLPSYAEVVHLKQVLAASRTGRRFSDFDIDSFYTKEIDFSGMKESVGSAYFDLFTGSYIGYFYDFSEVRVNTLEPSRLKMRYIVFHVYKKMSITGPTELCLYAVPFKRLPEAVSFKDRLDCVTAASDVQTEEGDLQDFFDESPEIRPNDLYTGKLTFFNDNRFKITMSNSSNQDEASILLLLPSVTDSYIGGLGVMNSITRGISKHPIAQKIIISRSTLRFDEGGFGDHLRIQTSNIPIDAEIPEIIQTYNALEGLGRVGLSDADRYHFLAYRLKALVDTYNEQLNLAGFQITEEEDNKVFHLLKHFSDR